MGRAEVSSSKICAVSTQPVKRRKKGFVVKSLVSKMLVSVSSSATLLFQTSRTKPSGCSGANATQLPLPTTSVCTGAGWTNAVQAARPFVVTESPCACPRPWKGLLPVFTPFDF